MKKTVEELKAELDAANAALNKAMPKMKREGKLPFDSEEFETARKAWHAWCQAEDEELMRKKHKAQTRISIRKTKEGVGNLLRETTTPTLCAASVQRNR